MAIGVLKSSSIATCISKCNINGVFVDIKTYKCDILTHDLPPWLWLCVLNFAVKT